MLRSEEIWEARSERICLQCNVESGQLEIEEIAR